jgi:hypothetical protein
MQIMEAALALAIMLVVVVSGLSLAMQSQRPLQPGARPARPVRPVRAPRPDVPSAPPRRPVRERRAAPPPPAAPEPAAGTDPGAASAAPPPPAAEIPELRRTGIKAEATVVSVVDERTVGLITRSRLTLKIQPAEGDSFEVQTRVAFPTPEARSKARVGGILQVRYDPKHHHRVIVELDEGDAGE